MNTAVVKLDTLTDSVRTSAEDHDLRLVAGYRILVRCIVSRVIISAVRCSTHVNAFPCFLYAEGNSAVPDIIFRNFQNLAQVFIRESIFLGSCQHSVGRKASLAGSKRFLFLHQLFHLLDEIMFYFGKLKDLVHSGALSQSFIHNKISLAGRRNELLQKLFFCHGIKILRMAETVLSDLQTADGFLERLFEVLSNAHNFAHGTHLGSQLILHAFELLKRPAGELDHHIVAVRHIFIKSSVLAARDILQSKSRCQHGGYQSDRESGRLGSQGGRAGSTRVNLDNDDTVRYRVMGELYICSADNLYGFHNLIRLLLHALLTFLGNGQHRRRTEGITCVHAQRIDVLDKADSDHVAFHIADNLKLQLFPAKNRLFHQHLSHKTGLQSSCHDCLQFFFIINQTAAGAAHSIGRTENHRITELLSDGKTVLHTVGNLASGHLDAQLVHGLLKLDAVLAALNSVYLHADYLHVIFIQNSFFI